MSVLLHRLARATAIPLLTLAWALPASANSNCASFFQTLYGSGPGTTWDSAGCQTCHASVPARNGYGADVGVCTVAAIQNAESLDSDTAAGQLSVGGDNLAEISAGSQPGWCVPTTPGCVNVSTPPSSITGPLDPPQGNNVPVAAAGGPYNGQAGTPVSFDGSASSDADGDALSYVWNFGDGDSGSGSSTTHAYSTAGVYTVSLVVNDGMADSPADTTTATISEPVNNQPPVAAVGGPYAGEAGIPVQFDGSASSDGDGDPLSYAWDFGDGTDGTGTSPVHTYASAGSYTVSLTVDDGQVASLPDSTTVAISAPAANAPPVADAGGPYDGETGALIRFDGTGSSDPNGDPITYLWGFGDGSTGAGPTPDHSYAAAGTYTVNLVVNDGQADSAATTTTVDVVDGPAMSDGETTYNTYCLGCHGDPWQDPAYDPALAGVHRVAGARTCTIQGSIDGTSVFPGGVPDMQFLQNPLTDNDIGALSEYLNSAPATGEQRYVSACAGCHGSQGGGGRVGEGVRGDSAGEIAEAIREESSMRFLSCLPGSDLSAIADYLAATSGGTDPGDDGDDDGSGGVGGAGLWFLAILAISRAVVRKRGPGGTGR